VNPCDPGSEEYEVWQRLEATEPYPPAELVPDDPAPDEQLTDLGHARRLVEVAHDRLRYVSVWRRWLAWDGRRWRLDTTSTADRLMMVVTRRVTQEAEALANDDKSKPARVRAALRAESATAIAGALRLASADATIGVTPDDLDADPFLLNVANGTLDLRTGQLHPHNPADLITKVTRGAYRADATGTAWAEFLQRVQPDQTMRVYLARLMGHMLEGRITEHVLPILYGEGANGKSTFVAAILAALGDYADAADPSLLMARSFDAHPTGVADLFRLRLALLHEADDGRHLAEGTVKRLTGADRLKARRMREDFWSFDPSHTFVMLTNHRPQVTGDDEGIWRRLRLIPWDVVIPVEERDGDLTDRLTAEADAVLGWLISGYLDWRAQGLAEPALVTGATANYRSDSDVLGEFLEQCCHTGAMFSVNSTALFTAWSKWCATEGQPAGTHTAFALAMKRRGHVTRKTMGRKVFDDIGLATTEAE